MESASEGQSFVDGRLQCQWFNLLFEELDTGIEIVINTQQRFFSYFPPLQI